MRKNKKYKYTVIGFYEDNNQIWAEHTSAEGVCEAVVKACTALAKRNERTDDDFFRGLNIVSVVEGHAKDLNDSETVSSAADWPGMLDDGTSGQDRESYSDDQDRESYSVKK